MTLTDADLMTALRTVPDPDLGKDLVSLGMVKSAAWAGETARIHVELTTPACPMKDKIRNDIISAVRRLSGATAVPVEVEFSARVRAASGAERPGALAQVAHVIAVGAGKGGVGKSTVAVGLALGLARMGAKVGLLDGDIYGPSMPTMLGLHDREAALGPGTFIPYEVHGIRTMSIGGLVDPEKAVIWRGPMLQSAFKQIAGQTEWGTLDYLVVDLPPGTGDIPLTLSQMLPLSGAVIVCTPQRVAQDDARRAVRMFQKLSVEIVGVVENMSYFVGDDGKTYDLFGRGGAQTMAAEMGLPFLGELPITTGIRQALDSGRPLEMWSDALLGASLDGICRSIAAQISVIALGTSRPTLTVH